MGRSIPADTGVAAAFADLLNTTQAPLMTFADGMIGEREEARDIVQDVFVDAWRAATQNKPPFVPPIDGAAVRRWLFHVAYCKTISLRRHRTVLKWEPLDPMRPSASVELRASAPFEDQIVEAQAVRAAVAGLDAEDAACLLLRVVEGFSALEVARILNITPDAARKRISRAVQRLRAAYFERSGELSEAAEAQNGRAV